MDQYISFKAGRRERWKAHQGEKGVRMAIERVGRMPGASGLTIFELGFTLTGPLDDSKPVVSYIEIPRSEWAKRFGAGGGK